MAIERIYTVPLRRAFSKAPNWRRTERAVNELRSFMQKHMKCDNVKIGKHLNLEMWSKGRKNPPARIQVKAVKDKEKIKDVEVDVVRVELVNAPIEVKKTKDVKKSKTTEKKESLGEKLAEEKKEVLEKPLDKKETNAQRTVGEGKDFKMHEQLQTKEIEKKMREEKMIPHDQKPGHQKKK